MPKRKSPSNHPVALDLSQDARMLAGLGQAAEKATLALNSLLSASTLLASNLKGLFPSLVDAFNGKDKEGGKEWNDAEIAVVLVAIRESIEKKVNFDVAGLGRWIRAHIGDAQAVVDCLTAEPPEEISILRLLSRAGSQKVVFLANWHTFQQEVVLKRFIRKDSDELIARELQPHPLSMQHPNIIETHLDKNHKGEKFLIEKRLQFVLSDDWRSHGVAEAANLLRDIASALAFLKDKHLVHGDIKPDNIGLEDGLYILLDFGICRPEGAFAESTPTGSLRTRAPELLEATGSHRHSHASDLWALGASVYNVVIGRFPLFLDGEVPPRISTPEDRAKFEAMLSSRAVSDWDRLVNLSKVPEPLKEILEKVLSRNPDERGTATEILKWCEDELAAVLRSNDGPSRFSPEQEVTQLRMFLPDRKILALMPLDQKNKLRARLSSLRQYKGLSQGQERDIKSLEEQLV
jgi:serine/threonine protein kinase